jgi:predicted nucleic acid-binding protein
MSGKKVFVDSNIFLYLLESPSDKKEEASRVLRSRPFISPQVIFENVNVAKKKFGLSKEESLAHGEKLLSDCFLILDTEKTVRKALELIRKDSLQVYDSRIIASALEAECDLLYSEDLQHLRVFEGKLTVVNPFIITTT